MGKTIILGAGLAGLSASYHLGHDNCVLLEREAHAYGHVKSNLRDQCTWDEGPHVSFTKHEYVRRLLANSVEGKFEEFPVKVGNYYQGHWIDHPSQVALYQVPEPLRSRCLKSFLDSRDVAEAGGRRPENYQQWLERAFGPVFAEAFPVVYTRKYWGRSPRDLTTEWVGGRVLYPAVEDVVAGARGPLGRNAHYISVVRYPRRGGFQSFVEALHHGADVRLSSGVARINLSERVVRLESGASLPFERLISTIPLPEFIAACEEAPPEVRDAAVALDCSRLLIVNVIAPHPARRPETWFYVYDEDKLATRVNFTERLSPANAPTGSTGIQTEVYASRRYPRGLDAQEIVRRVTGELGELGLIDPGAKTVSHGVPVHWANVIFDHDTKPALEIIWRWLEQHGLRREAADTHPLTDWASRAGQLPLGRLAFAGRFGQWKYYWTDDCILRGREIAERTVCSAA